MKTFEIKDGVNLEEIQKMKPLLFVVLGYFLEFCQLHNLPAKITNIGSVFHVSVSTTHSEGRAFDASVKGWTKRDISDCIQFLDDKVGYAGAYSLSDGKQRVAVYHDAGLGPHFHMQIRR